MRVFGVVVACLVILGLVAGMVYVGVSNHEVSVRLQTKAKQKDLENVFDKTWKTISQRAQISEKYKADFKDIYVAIMDGRYGDDGMGGLVQFMHEANPQLDSSIYTGLASAVEANRAELENCQTSLIDLQREHKNILMTFPGSLLLTGRQPVEIQIVTSTKTDEVFQTGKDNEIDLFED